jgi:radical SAM superfamily enzyme YgiQ (UPF0313 family)
VIGEVRKMTADPEFQGRHQRHRRPDGQHVRDALHAPEVEAVPPALVRASDDLQAAGHRPRSAGRSDEAGREEPGVKKVFVASGIRMDLARRSPEYMKELATHHVGGLLKVAPEHTDSRVLDLMKKPGSDDFEVRRRVSKGFREGRQEAVSRPVLHRQPPGSDLDAMIDLALFLKRNGYRPDQVQDFIPSPVRCRHGMYYTGLDPFTMKPVYTLSTCATASCSEP